MKLLHDGGCLSRVLFVVIGNTGIQGFTAVNDGGQRFHGLLQRSFRIHAVMIENIHIIQLKSFKTLIDAGSQIFFAAPVTVRTGPHIVSGF